MSCPDCTRGDFLPGELKGSFSPDFQGAYFTSGSGEAQSKRAVILLTDAFGLPLKNCKIIADEIATRLECDVWVPDYFNGGHFNFFLERFADSNISNSLQEDHLFLFL